MRPGLQPLLRQQTGTDTPARQRALGGLVAAQVALALVLGIGATLTLRSLWHLQHVDPGFDPVSALTFRLQTTSSHRALTTGVPYLQRMGERVGALPGVTTLGAINHLPMSGYTWSINIHRPDAPPAPGTQPPRAAWRFIWGDYFGAMRIPDHRRPRLPRRRQLGRTRRGDCQRTPRAGALRERGGGPRPAPGAAGRRTSGAVRRRDCRRRRRRAARRPGQPAAAGDLPSAAADVHVPDADRPARERRHPAGLAERCARRPTRSTLPCRLRISSPFRRCSPTRSGGRACWPLLLSIFAAIGVLLSVVGLYGVVAVRVGQRDARDRHSDGARRARREPWRAASWGRAFGYALGACSSASPRPWLVARYMDSVDLRHHRTRPVDIRAAAAAPRRGHRAGMLSARPARGARRPGGGDALRPQTDIAALRAFSGLSGSPATRACIVNCASLPHADRASAPRWAAELASTPPFA